MPMLDSSLRPFRRFWCFRFVRFLGGGVFNLSIRLILVNLFIHLGFSLSTNYALVHLITLIFAYFYHSAVTFGVRPSRELLKRFMCTVIVLRLLDYGFVVAATQSSSWLRWVSSTPWIGDFLGRHLVYFNVLLASTFILAIRYLIFTRITFAQSKPHDGESKG